MQEQESTGGIAASIADGNVPDTETVQGKQGKTRPDWSGLDLVLAVIAR